jgi:plasmid stability protein
MFRGKFAATREAAAVFGGRTVGAGIACWLERGAGDCVSDWFYTDGMSTIELPDDVAAALAVAAAERGVSADELAAEILAARFGPRRRTLSFVAAGRSGMARGGAEAEELLDEDGFGVDTTDR